MHDQVVSDEAMLLPRPGSQKLVSCCLECIGILNISSTLTLNSYSCTIAELSFMNLMPGHSERHGCDMPMLQEAASGEQMSKLQKDLEQLRTNFGQTKVHLQAAQQSQRDAQVPPSCLDAVSILGAVAQFPVHSIVLCCFAIVGRRPFFPLPVFCLFLSLLHLIFAFLLCVECLLPELVLVMERSGPSQQHRGRRQNAPLASGFFDAAHTLINNCFSPCLIQGDHTSNRPCSVSGCQS